VCEIYQIPRTMLKEYGHTANFIVFESMGTSKRLIAKMMLTQHKEESIRENAKKRHSPTNQNYKN